jgi:hypothetical protein
MYLSVCCVFASFISTPRKEEEGLLLLVPCVFCVCKFHLRTHPPPAAMQTPQGEKMLLEKNSASVGDKF